MKKKDEGWEYLEDTPDEFDSAIKSAVSENEREFFKKLRYKLLHETAFSNDILMYDWNNDEGLYLYRVGTDDFMIGKWLSRPKESIGGHEFTGLFGVLEEDLYPWLGRHITLWQWLRDRDYKGISYDTNNDYM